MMMSLSEATTLVDTPATQLGEASFTAVGIDSRQIQQGQLFVALRGENFDGHDFARAALDAGAAAVMLERNLGISPSIIVDDSLCALQNMASAWRARFPIPLIGVTGSCGKTTVKDMIASILRAHASSEAVLATSGNLNNHIGVPLTLLRLRSNQRYAVVEMGMNHRSELRLLSQLARPSVAVINNAGTAHLGELGSLQAIAEAKAEILEGLPTQGIAVLNADDPFFTFWRHKAAGCSVLSFARHAQADIGLRVSSDGECYLLTADAEARIPLNVLGEHNQMNALAASAAAIALNIPLSSIVQGLSSYYGTPARLEEKLGRGGTRVIDDTYNANPASMRAAIEVLATYSGEKILVIGDMAELGVIAGELHHSIGLYAKQQGITRLLALGELSKQAVQAFGAGGQHFDHLQALLAVLNTLWGAEVTMLVKGSRMMAMERVVAQLINSEGVTTCCSH